MMPIRAQRIQGLVFCATALAVAASAELVQRLDPQTELVAMAILIVILGVPHGVLDTVFARNLYNVRTAKEWVGFTVVYFIPAALVVALWQFAPQLFLAGFLVISIVHFSGDPSPGTPVFSRVFYGGAIIVLPTIFYAPEVTQLFSFLVGPDAAMQTVAALLYLKWPWLVGLVLAAIARMQSDWLSGLEIAALGLIATLAPPLVAFTVFFCIMHSARHILRTMNYFDQISLSRIVFTAATPMLVTVILSVAAWNSFGDTAIDVRVSQLVFVGLAALTVPHMAIVERVRLSGWIRKS
ncbi:MULTISPECIES: Brp/Blh family beta-carotene 15,15'-dioxygenase [unclassified Tardiphaga]|uniref:Brp/Blh family beta-carotene 15,15'-dioxygenase n=1 Tax=unclassified Tardiphaga TaxID=2631404 RepID=UPI001AEE73CE|nr:MULTISPECIES: Brp/Blh family beta-carotene 15,15'-dioxygenase [unclassified Tardiphaga]